MVLPVGTCWTDGACSDDHGGTSVVVASSAATAGGCVAIGLRLPSAAHLLDPLQGEEQKDVLEADDWVQAGFKTLSVVCPLWSQNLAAM